MERYASDADDVRPLRQLRNSLHNLYNYDIFAALPTKIHKIIINYLDSDDKETARLVCRTWNSILVKHMKFWIELSDPSRFLYMQTPSPEPLRVYRVVVRNLRSINDPRNPREILRNFHMRSHEDIRKLIIRDGTPISVLQKVLTSYHYVLEELNFIRPTFPIYPPKTTFGILKSLEVTVTKYDEDTQLAKNFFQVTFPLLERLKLDFFARKNFVLYVGAHHFAAQHASTLRNLSLNFGYSISELDTYSKDQLASNPMALIKKNAKLIKALEKEKQYKKVETMYPMMKLSQISLNLFLNEEGLSSPWNLSLKLLNSQINCVKVLRVQHPLGLRDNYNFSKIISQNALVLEKLSIPCVQKFDCKVLAGCHNLHSFSIGPEFCFNHLFFGNEGTIINFSHFPANSNALKSVSICLPLSKSDILWLSSSLSAHSLMVSGVENEFFRLAEVMNILNERKDLEQVMMRIYMKSEASNTLETYLKSHPELFTVSEYFHAGDCGFTTFAVRKSLYKSRGDYKDWEDYTDDDGDDIRFLEPLEDDESS